MYTLAHTNNITELMFYALIINYLFVLVVRTLYRYRKIQKYHYDYYGVTQKSKLSKLSNNLVEVFNKISTFY